MIREAGRSGPPPATDPGRGVDVDEADPGGFEVGIVGLVLALPGPLLSAPSRLLCISADG